MSLERLTIKISSQLKRRLKQVCLDLDVTMQDFLAPLVEREVERMEMEIMTVHEGKAVANFEIE